MIKFTDEDHPDLANLRSAHAQMETVCSDVNENQRKEGILIIFFLPRLRLSLLYRLTNRVHSSSLLCVLLRVRQLNLLRFKFQDTEKKRVEQLKTVAAKLDPKIKDLLQDHRYLLRYDLPLAHLISHRFLIHRFSVRLCACSLVRRVYRCYLTAKSVSPRPNKILISSLDK